MQQMEESNEITGVIRINDIMFLGLWQEEGDATITWNAEEF